MRVVKTEGRTKTYGLPEPPDGDGDKAPKKKEKPTRRSEGSNVVPFPGSPIVDAPKNLSSPSPHLYRDGDGDDVEERGAEPYSDSLSGQHHPHLITSEKDLKALVRYIASEATEVAIDLETCPPGKALDPRNGSIRLISVATEGLNKAVDVSKVHPGPLLDALKAPNETAALPDNVPPSSDETPFFCLLEDDSLITNVDIQTAHWLEPDVQDSDEVVLLLRVRTKPTRVTWGNMGLA